MDGYLTLSRKKDERIFCSNGLEIMVVSISRNKVKLGLRAPENVIISREEVAEHFGINVNAFEGHDKQQA